MDWSPYIPYLIPATVLSLAAVAKVAGDLSTQAEAKQSSRVSRIESTVSRLAGGMAADLATMHAAGTTGDALTAVKNAAIAQAATYMATVMPDTLKAAGATPASLTTMLTGEVGKQLAATAPAVLAGAANALHAVATGSPSPAASVGIALLEGAAAAAAPTLLAEASALLPDAAPTPAAPAAAG